MGKPLPTGNFQWVRGGDLKKFSDPTYIQQLDCHASKGYFLEVKYYYCYYYYYMVVVVLLQVDLDYDPSLHDYHNEFPLAPETMTVTEDMLSPYQREQAKHFGVTAGGGGSKIILNLNHKKNYVLHFW